MSSPPAVTARQAPPVVAPPPGNPRFPLFDSLRAIAALCVLTTHVAFLTGASYGHALGALLAQLTIGVPIFFLISGFLLYRPYVAARARGEPGPRVRDYARRRVLRIVPAYWLALTVLAVYPGLTGVFTGDWWIYYGFGQIYSEQTQLRGMPQAWSLAVEAAFYVMLPLYALAIGRLAGARGALRLDLALLLGLYLASIGFRIWAHGTGRYHLLQTLPGTLDWFTLGMGAAVASVALDGRARPHALARFVTARPGICWAAALVAFVLLSTQLDLPRGLEAEYTALQRFLQHVVFGLVALLLLLPAVFGDRAGGVPRRILALPMLAWLGTISYGIFLWNLGVAKALAELGIGTVVPDQQFAFVLVCVLAVTLAFAATSYYVLERPILRLKHRRGRPPVARRALAREPAG